MKSFVNDLLSVDDTAFCNRVIRQTFAKDGSFRNGKYDHRYHGIKNAWIRYVSRGSTQYRLIYIRHGKDIYLYRAGHHSIEDNLTAPSSFSEVADSADDSFAVHHSHSVQPWNDIGDILVSRKRYDEHLISEYFEKMFHLGHNEIFLISPFMDFSLFQKHKPFGRFLDRQIEDGALVSLLTGYVSHLNELRVCEDLSHRQFNLFFLGKLHTKLYLFEIDQQRVSEYFADHVPKVAILGSSNLTEPGVGFKKNDTANWELCYRPEHYRYDELRMYAQSLSIIAKDLPEMRREIGR